MSILDTADELGHAVAYHEYLNRSDSNPITFEQFKKWRGSWSEVNNSEWAGMTSGTYPTREEAVEAARKAVSGCRGEPMVWACEEAV